MSEAKFTPGPWRWEVNRAHRRVELCGGATVKFDYAVMTFSRYGMDGAAPNFWTWAHGIGDRQRADALAVEVAGREHHASWFAGIDHPDAHLIAAAPDLYGLVVEMLDCLDPKMVEAHDSGALAAFGLVHSGDGCSICKARRILAKARGES